MPRNEEGEFELVLANRQLLSVFFIVVILLGVFFTMGYIVGRSSAPVTTADATPPRRADAKPLVVDSAGPAASREPVSEAPVQSPKQPVSTAPQQPAEPVKAEPKQTAAAKPEPAKPEPVKTNAVKAEPKAAAKAEASKLEPVRTGKSEPASGETYLQLVATLKAEADVMVDVLKKKGFRAIETTVPNKDGWFRVLVGPVPDGTVNKVRADLESSGFPGDKAIKKTF